MPYKIKVDGLEEISDMLTKMADRAPSIAAQGLYDGAGIMAEAINKSADEIRTEPFTYKKGSRLPSPEEKEIVMKASAGIARFRKGDGDVNTSVGYKNAGYADLNGKTVPIPVIVNAINSGTSFMQKQPFVRKAANKAKQQATQAIKAKIEEAFEAITKE